MGIEHSHGRARVMLRPDEVPSLPQTAGTDADRDPRTGRFLPANGAARARAVKRAAREQRLLGLDPTKAAPWLAPYIVHAQTYAGELSAAVPQTPALGVLCGDAATAATVYRALLAAATSAGTIDTELLAEARSWLREHRTCLATLGALAKTASMVEEPDAEDVAHEDVEEGGAEP